MELRLKQWISIFEEQAKSGLNKQDWCEQNNIKRTAFFKWQRELQKYLLKKSESKCQDKKSTELAIQTTPDFIELTPKPISSLERPSIRDCYAKSSNIPPASSISIRRGEFTIDLNDDVNELLLSRVLKVMADVY